MIQKDLPSKHPMNKAQRHNGHINKYQIKLVLPSADLRLGIKNFGTLAGGIFCEQVVVDHKAEIKRCCFNFNFN